MTGANAPSHDVDLPAEWEPERYPVTDRDWLDTSVIAIPIGVAVTILVADPLEDGSNGPVYPLAVTTDATDVVYKRQYNIFDVATSRSKAHEKLESAATAISDEFAAGTSDFLTEAVVRTIDADSPRVRSVSLEKTNA